MQCSLHSSSYQHWKPSHDGEPQRGGWILLLYRIEHWLWSGIQKSIRLFDSPTPPTMEQWQTISKAHRSECAFFHILLKTLNPGQLHQSLIRAFPDSELLPARPKLGHLYVFQISVENPAKLALLNVYCKLHCIFFGSWVKWISACIVSIHIYPRYGLCVFIY
jgi:hypothetical protein